MRDVPIRGDVIRLGQLLKVSGVAGTGGEAKQLLEAGLVLVNGEADTRRGRQLRHGDVVVVGSEKVRVSSSPTGTA
jgi:ribosome-associated protein